MNWKKYFGWESRINHPVEVKKPKNPEAFKDKKVDLLYTSLNLRHLEQSDIPDEFLKSINISGHCPKSPDPNNSRMQSADFIFAPVKGKIYWKGVNHYISIGVSVKRNRDGTWEKDFDMLNRFALGLQHIVGGKLVGLDDEENHNPKSSENSCFLTNPEMEMTQKEIVRIARRIRDELGVVPMGVRRARYTDVIPKDPLDKGLGFNLPKFRLRLKEWK